MGNCCPSSPSPKSDIALFRIYNDALVALDLLWEAAANDSRYARLQLSAFSERLAEATVRALHALEGK